ncbi:MAG: PAC2 family protein [Candidatus Omnitrophota bacterium]|nr:PAC2 family protein [Candidatus Omnitrophota bacterium]
MDEIKIYKNIDFVRPVMIGGWPGMGSVALGVVDYLQKKLKAFKFAEIRIDPLTTLDSVVVENGIASLPPNPQNVFYYIRDPELIIFKSEAQVPGSGGIELLKKVIDLASGFRVSRIYTGAAFPFPISYKDAPHVYGAVNNKALLEIISSFGLSPMDGGHISGLNGLLLGFAQKRGIEAACLLATMPQYAISLPNPKASGAIIDALQRILKFKVDMRELEDHIKDMDEKMAMIEDRVKDVLTIEKDSGHEPHHSERKVPPYIMEKIEKLFIEAESDKAKAIPLKIELDRWDLYNSYEDRFLSLFKKNQ